MPIKSVVALDVGGTNVKVGVVGEDKHLLSGEPVTLPIRQDGSFGEIINVLSGAVNHVKDKWSIDGAGIAMPGPFDYEEGISWMKHKFASLYGRNIKNELQERFGVPIYFLNDAEAFALGAWWTNPDLPRKLLAITLGTGLGACFVVDGVAVRFGPEVPQGGELWNVSWRSGILEDFISRRAIEAMYKEAQEKDSSLPTLEGVKEIAESARKGNKAAQRVFKQFGENIGEGLALYAVRFRPELIVLGGQISKAFDLFGVYAQEILRRESGQKISMIQSSLGDATAIAGAGYHCLRKLRIIG